MSSLKFLNFFILLLFFSFYSCENNPNENANSPSSKTVDTAIKSEVKYKPFLSECSSMPDHINKKKCTNKILDALIRENIIYPESAKNENRKGSIQVKAQIDINGDITSLSLFKKMGPGNEDLTKEALRVAELIKDMNMKWEPAVNTADEKVKSAFVFPLMRFPLKKKLTPEQREAFRKLKEAGAK